MGRLSEQQRLSLIEEYKSGDGLTVLSRRYGVYKNAVYGLLDRRGIFRHSKYGNGRVHTVDEGFFDTIDTEDKAYWLGFLFADGNIHRYSVGISLQRRDENHLLKFRDIIKSDYVLFYRQEPLSCRLRINSVKWINALRQHGMSPGKKSCSFIPVLDDTLIIHFIRGVFDGDGWVVYRENRGYFCAGIASCCQPLLSFICDWVSKNVYPTRSQPFMRARLPDKIYYKTTYQVSWDGKWVVYLLSAMYDNARVYLDRKYEIYKKGKFYVHYLRRGRPRQFRLVEKDSC